MVARKTAKDRLADLEQQEKDLMKKKSQLSARKKQLEAILKAKERRERTHRLIIVAGTFEHHWGYLDTDRADYLARKLQVEAEKLLATYEEFQNQHRGTEENKLETK